MRKNPTHKIKRCRVTDGLMPSAASDGPNGLFLIPYLNGVTLRVIASDGRDWSEAGLPGQPWEHVSVSLPNRCPTWEEMDFVKRLFWRDDELVLQLHVPRDQHINVHLYCLHLWKPIGVEIPVPPQATVGI